MNTFLDYFKNIQEHKGTMGFIHTCPELMACVRHVGFLPLLESGIPGLAAESLMAEECRFTQFEDGTWEWPRTGQHDYPRPACRLRLHGKQMKNLYWI